MCLHIVFTYNAMIQGDSFTGPHTGGKYPVNSKISCHTKFAIYLLKYMR